MSLFELQDMVEKLGLHNDSSIYYCKPWFGLKDGLVKVATDENVLEIFKEYVNCTCIVIYVDNAITSGQVKCVQVDKWKINIYQLNLPST